MQKEQIGIIETDVPNGYDQRWFKITIQGQGSKEKKELSVKLSGHAFISLYDKFGDHLDDVIIALGYTEFLKNRVEIALAFADVEGISPEFLQKGQFEITKLSDGLFDAVKRVF